MHISTPLKHVAFFVIFSLNALFIQAQSFVEVSTTVAGVTGSHSWGDYDRDGNIDIITTGGTGSGRATAIYKNNGNSTFTKQTAFILNGVSSSYVNWGDYNNDGFLDVLLNGYTGTGYFSAIYKNGTGTSFTEQTQFPFLDVSDGNLTFCDYNNDGAIDVLVTGYNASAANTILYKNIKNNYVEQTGIVFDKLSDSYASWGDYDNDGYADLLLSGSLNGNFYSFIYKNNGNNTFTKQSISITGVHEGSSAWGDYNNDGYLDFVITGKNSSGYYSQIYKNNGNGTFTLQSISLPGVAYSSVAWGDYDSDGDLDLLLAGVKSATYTDCITKLYRNNNDNTFSEVTDFTMTNAGFACVQFVDFNNDSKLDISVNGYDGASVHYFKLYKNMLSSANTAPNTPANLTSLFTGTNSTNMTFKWDKSTDTETPQNGLSYNLYLYKEGSTVLSKAADAFTQTQANNGKRLVAKIGNIQHNANGYNIDGLSLSPGTYKWSVQAIDGAFTGSAFATEQTIVSNIFTPSKNLVATPSGTSMSLSWQRGNGDKCILIAKENGTGTFDPVNNTTYAANAVYGNSQMGTSGWHCVYNGTGNSITVTGLKPLTSYTFRVIEYVGIAGSEQYDTGVETTASLTKFTSLFTQVSTFDGMTYSSVAWCDYDNDGDLDYVASGETDYTVTTRLYRNDGANTFTSINAGFPNIYYSSLSWGDYDNDGYCDLAISGSDYSSRYTKIYHNNKNGTFSELTGVTFPGYNAGNIIWGDYNNDGFSDLFLCGSTGSNVYSKIYLNTKTGSFIEQTNINITGIDFSSALWLDLDNDADLDLLVSGYILTDYISKIYKNEGNGSFTEITGLSIPQIANTFIDAGDYDSDGDLDLLFTGNVYNNGPSLSKVFRNEGNFSFAEQTAIQLPAVKNGSSKWADYDNDGDLDIIMNGNGISNSKIYKNTSNTFTEETNIILPGTKFGSMVWGDYDNDSDLDFIITGNTGSANIAAVYRNDITSSNVIPAAPTGLSATTDAVLSWTAVTGDATPGIGLTYNVRVGTATGKTDIVSPLSATTGFRRIPAIGNAQTGTTFKLGNLKKGTYYWGVQAIDNSFAGGQFAAEQTFVYNVDIPASSMNITNIRSTSLKCTWTRGNGDKCVLFVKENGTGDAVPVNSTTYIANKVFTSGMEIGSTGWRCVYNNSGDSVTVSGLKPNTSYAFHVIEYTGNAGAEIYYTASEVSSHFIQTTSMFTEQTALSFSNVYAGTVSWGDYDNDDDQDILLTGDSGSERISKIYKNNGNSTFTEQTGITLTGVSVSSTEWCDFDNDGDLDILLVGFTGSYRISKIYMNNGNNTFTELTGLNLTGVSSAKVACADYDNDGDMDFLLTGHTGTENVSKIYRNNGNNSFTEQTSIAIVGVYDGSVAWGDYDNDNDLDFFLSGFTGSSRISKIYKNNGNGTFTDQTSIVLSGVASGEAAWGDYDSDGDLDLLYSGYTGVEYISVVYKNNGNNAFTKQNFNLTGIRYGSSIWGDYDNDGDLDILVAGINGASYINKIYRNDDGSFVEQSTISLPGATYISVRWGDYDKDGDLDILLAGDSGAGKITRIYRNEIQTPNTVPAAPVNLTSSTVGDDVKLQWSPVTSDATQSMTYNIRVGRTSAASNLISGMSNSVNGFRKIVSMGNAQQKTSFTLKNLKKGTYYWSAQAIDNSFAGGTFSSEGTFTYSVEHQAKSIIIEAKNATSVKCSWTRGNGDKCLVFAKENGTGNAAPANSTTYTGNKAFGSGTQIGTSGWFCVYNGEQDTATITNLKPNTKYLFQVHEYTGAAGSEILFTTTGTGNPAQYIPSFTEETQITLTGVSGHTNAWGDYDNDGDFDLFLCGYTGSANAAELYKNNGDNTFTKTSVTFASHTFYDVQWGDYDNDNDLDLLVLTDTDSKVYENNGDGTFTAGTPLPIMSGGKGLWADFNNDGYKDIIIVNMFERKVLKNNKDKTFTFQSTTMPDLVDGSVACGDYDNDGDVDVLLAGRNGSTEVTKVFRNDGDFIFTEQTSIVLPGISNCTVAWADMDNDGDLDIIMSGANNSFYTKIYNNNGNNTFSVLAGTTFKDLYRTAMAIGDYDNDGDRDLIVSGSNNGDDYYTVLYQNNGNSYSEIKTVGFPGIQFGSLNWGDYDIDNDLDLFMCGVSSTGRIAKIYKNNGLIFNEKPNVPSLSNITLDGNNVNFKWNKPLDSKTVSNGLSYNLYVYEVAKPGFKQSGEAFTQTNTLNGKRLVASFGNIQYSTTGYTLKGLPAGDYKCSIQAVDAGMLGSHFASETSFSIYDLTGVGVDCTISRITNTKTGMQYSINSTDGVNGTWTEIEASYQTIYIGSGGFDVWVRQSDNIKNKVKVASIATKASAPSFTINYLNETTNENVPATVEYSTNSQMSGAVIGTGNPVTLIPGSTLYIRTKATTAAIASAIQSLAIPSRPAIPAISIDYHLEKTAQAIPATVVYSNSQSIEDTTSGSGIAIDVVPGQTLYFRTKATSTSFKSALQNLSVPARPADPNFSINFGTEKTNEILTSAYEYTTDVNLTNFSVGIGNKLTIVPGQNLYIRTKATSTSFKSGVQTIISPARLEKPAYTIDFIGEMTMENVSPSCAYSSDSISYYAGNSNKINIVPGQKLYLLSFATSRNFKSEIQTLIAPARPAAPTNLKVHDGTNTFDWDFVPNYTEVSEYEYTTNGGSWQLCTSKPMNIGSVNVPAGSLKVRLKATTARFKGVEAASKSSFTTGVMDLEKAGIRMYPNPVSDILYLENLPVKSEVAIYSISGKLLIKRDSEEVSQKISVSDLPQGLFLIRVNTPDGEFQSKFTKL